MFYTLISLWLLLANSQAFAAKKGVSDQPSWTVNSYKILQVEQSRLSKGRLERWLFQGPIAQQKRVLLAMARIGDPAFIEPLNKLLNKSRHSELRQAAAFTLGTIEGDTAYLFVSQNIPMHKDPQLSRELLMAAGRKGNARAIKQLSYYLKPSFPVPIQDGAAWGLGHAFAVLDDKIQDQGTLIALADLLKSERVALSAAFALSRWQGDPNLIPVGLLNQALLEVWDTAVRSLIYRALGKSHSATARDALIRAMNSSQEKNERIEILKAFGNQDVNDALVAAIANGLADSSRHVQVTAIQSAVRLKANGKPLTERIDTLFLGSGSEWVRAESIIALASIAPDTARLRIQQQIKQSSGLVLKAMAYSFTLLGTETDFAYAIDFLSSPHPPLTQRVMDGLLLLSPEQFTPVMKEGIRQAILRGDAGVVATAADLIEKFKWTTHLESLMEIYSRFTSDDSAEIRSAVVRTVGEVGGAAQVPFLESALTDRFRIVTEAASRGLKKITGHDYPFPLNGAGAPPMPSTEQLSSALKKMVTVQTSRGDFILRFNEDTPVTAYYFLKEAPLQVGRTFHRIVPNFVVQGGDPRGDGFGGAGFSLRDEISSRPHDRGSIGMATAGKDTGGCQFFVNTAPNPHLLGRYTNFARVISGIEVIDRLEPNDTILKVRIHSNR